MDNEKIKDVITNAIIALKNNVDNASLSVNEKNALLKLLDNMLVYYQNKKALILGKRNNNCEEKIAGLQGFIIDVIVEINSILTKDTDVHYFVSLMQNKLNGKDFKKILKHK